MPENLETGKTKENLPQGIVTPTRQKNTGLNSPAQTKNLWDSGDPMRNPPPLPLSPQMLKTASGKNKHASPSSPIGKLQFTAVDTTEIEYQLHRIIDSQSALKSLLQGIDTSVKHTQLDLDNLNQRSANNNSHLKNLLENVPTGSTTSSADDVQHSIQQLQEALNKKMEDFDSIKEEITAALSALSTDNTKRDDTAMLKELGGLKELLSSMPMDQHKDLLDQISRGMKDQYDNHSTLKDAVSKGHAEVHTSLQDVLKAVEGLSLHDHIKSLRDGQHAVEKSLKDQHALLSDKSSTVALDNIVTSLDSLKQELVSARDSVQQKSNNDSAAAELITKVEALEETIGRTMTEHRAKLKDDVAAKLVEIEALHKDTSEKSSGLEKMTRESTENMSEKLDSVCASLATLSASMETRADEKVTLEVEKMSVQLSLKDKEIAELKAQLEQEKQKSSISSDILELTERKAKLEAKLEGLEDVYKSRYADIKLLAKEHEELTTKLLDFNSDRLKSIAGAAAFTQVTLDESKIESSRYKKTGATGNRVLSTNSYLTNRRSTLSPKAPKTYDLSPIEGETSDKENL
ncbi:CYFA0S06e01992g1_1 [Cyberlindnera fabianii]|uniref:CYFA0S06e01992g1_1 n=1 Tax=Cyberlindnera fabianii TaxID=36022 RepID=A0A061AU07_CYBFA|nr:CYFA0S06e01992g1_1 [Cyberlindnera fabianii]